MHTMEPKEKHQNQSEVFCFITGGVVTEDDRCTLKPKANSGENGILLYNTKMK